MADNKTVPDLTSHQIMELHVKKCSIAQIYRVILYMDALFSRVWF